MAPELHDNVPLRPVQAFHLAEASSWMAQGWEVVLSPAVACLYKP